jgi:hypothetical protein
VAEPHDFSTNLPRIPNFPCRIQRLGKLSPLEICMPSMQTKLLRGID